MKNLLPIVLINLFFLCGSNNSFAQAPNLGTAAPYTLFTAVGAFDNLGSSTVSGNIGTNVGAYTGFPPGLLIGTAHIADGVSAQVALDVNSAYSQLSAVSCTQVMGVSIGDETLAPGVYCSGAATTLNGELILDGLGDQNAFFIIKINGSFTTGANSRISFVNGASAKNTYWQVNGEVTLSDHSFFFGTIIANGAITMLEAAQLNGRALSISGAIALHNNFVLLSATILAAAPNTFAAKQDGDAVLLNWLNNDGNTVAGFTIEHSSNGTSNWTNTGIVQPATVTGTTYQFTDHYPTTGMNYYRLMTTYTNGSYKRSNIAVVSFKQASGQVQVFPNPATTVTMINGLQKGAVYVIYDITGRTTITGTAASNNNLTIPISNLNPGLYTLSFIQPSGDKHSIKFIKQ